jgi:predicted MFS family arabinose efflux permease
MVAGLSVLIAIAIATYLKPLTAHLAIQHDKTAFKHLWHTITNGNYRIAYTATALLSIGGFMMMPFGSAFAVNNLGIDYNQLTMLLMVSGLSSLLFMPLIGKLSDRINKFTIFAAASVWMMVICVIYTNLTVTPLPIVIALNILMMMGIMSRMIPSSALTSAVPDMADRGAFMSINSSLQQIAGGIAAAVAGMIVTQESKGSPLVNYNVVGYVIVVISTISIFLMWRVSNLIKKKSKPIIVQEPEPVVQEI